jgi:hypothetical protein
VLNRSPIRTTFSTVKPLPAAGSELMSDANSGGSLLKADVCLHLVVLRIGSYEFTLLRDYIRSTRAWPLRADHAMVPLSILATILETFLSVMSPTMFLQRTIASSSARAAVAASEIAIAAAIAPGREMECICSSIGCQGEAAQLGTTVPPASASATAGLAVPGKIGGSGC